MTSPALMGRLEYGVTSRHGPALITDDPDTAPHWGTRQQAVWTLYDLRALYPHVDYRLTTRRALMMDCPDCGRLLTRTEYGHECRHCGEES